MSVYWCVFRYNRRHIALRLAYLGAQYQGMVIQDNATPTVEVGVVYVG